MRSSAALAPTLGVVLAFAGSVAQGAGPVVVWGAGAPPPKISASAIAVGPDGGACAIRTGIGAVVCWGSDSIGQSTPPPAADGTDGGASAVAVGSYHTLALPEPDDLTMLIAGITLLAALPRRRR